MMRISRIGKPLKTPTNVDSLYVFTVAFNKEDLIRKQYELLKKHLKDKNFHYIVADNSCKQKRPTIRNLCKELGIEYISIPKYIHFCALTRLFYNGMSHGAALNYLFFHYIAPLNPPYFAIIDHDMFLLKDYNFKAKLTEEKNKDFYGAERKRGETWYLWPGFAIFNMSVFENIRPNFLPYFNKERMFCDAGSKNYIQLYKHYDYDKSSFAHCDTRRIKVTKGLKTWNEIFHSDFIHIIDHCWLHLINGSNYAKTKGKEKTIQTLLRNLEKIKI